LLSNIIVSQSFYLARNLSVDSNQRHCRWTAPSDRRAGGATNSWSVWTRKPHCMRDSRSWHGSPSN